MFFINDEEFNEILKPFLDNYDECIESYIMPGAIEKKEFF